MRDVFVKRARTIKALRDFLDGEGMLEVETPILQPLYGGAAARPFVTHHNQLHQDLYLRISFELYLKRLLVGGYDAVYEIGRDFRNEGVSYKHNTEFTMLEFYKAYIDYAGVMDITERMFAYTAEQVTGSSAISYQGETIDLAPPWKRLSIREAVRKILGFDYMDYPAAGDRYMLSGPARAGRRAGPADTWGRMIVEHLLGNHIEPKLDSADYHQGLPARYVALRQTHPGRRMSQATKRSGATSKATPSASSSSSPAWRWATPSPS